MKSQIKILRQLQELVLTRDEHHQTGDGSHLDSLNDSIADLKSKLKPQVALHYDRIYKRNHVVLSAMSNGCCAACGMHVPTAQSQQVRLGEHLVTCSGCGRILFANEPEAPKNVAERVDRDDVKTGISRFSDEVLMIPDMGMMSRDAAITRLARTMEETNFISNADRLISMALERENVLSTAMDGEIAMPHVRGVEGGALTLAMGVSREGIDWDGEKVHIVFMSAIPVAVSAFYLRLMAGLTQAFSRPETREAAINAEDAASLWKVLVKATRTTVR